MISLNIAVGSAPAANCTCPWIPDRVLNSILIVCISSSVVVLRN